MDSGALKQALDRVYAVEEAMTGLRRERLQAARLADARTAGEVSLLLHEIPPRHAGAPSAGAGRTGERADGYETAV